MSSIKDLSYEHQQVVEAMKSQLLIVLFNRLGGSVEIPASEIDGTGAFNLAMRIDPNTRAFHFEVQEKSQTAPRRTLVDGSPVTADHREIDPRTGQQKAYVVLSAEDRAKGFVRPVRRSYIHTKCGVVTTMGHAIAETYARDPGFYTHTFCAHCRNHFPVGADGEFVWDGTDEKVGT